MNILIRALISVLCLFAALAAGAQTCKYDSIPATAPASRFTDNGDGTVTDTLTGLMWKRCSEGQTWDGATCTGTATQHDWQQALQRADVAIYASRDDWRLPNAKELSSIVEQACFAPAIDLDVFPATPGAVLWSGVFWASTPLANLEGYAWATYFRSGESGGWGHANLNHVRLVRGGKADGPLNDTGLDWWADALNNYLPSEPADHPGQDASYGRDRSFDDDSDGHAGFRFTKLDSTGNVLPSSAASWTCVRDEVSGLTWEIKADDNGLRDKDWTYTWYNPDPTANGGSPGTPDGGDNCYSTSRCDTAKFVADVNAAGLCGAADWRLPTREELRSIIDHSRYNPPIDIAWFPFSLHATLGYWWTSSPLVESADYARVFASFHGDDYYFRKSDAYPVRLVRGAWLASPLSAPGTAQVNQTWTRVEVPSGYSDAIVIVGPPSYRGSAPGVARLRNVDDRGFDLRFQEWAYLDDRHAREAIDYLMLAGGRHTLSDGSIWEAGTFDLGGTKSWETIAYSAPFGRVPQLLLTVQTANDPSAVTVRARNLTTAGFQAALFEEEAANDGHGLETIGFLAIDSPAGGGLLDLNGESLPYLLQTLTGDERWSPVLSQRLKVEEERSRDSEVDHGDETLHVLALGNHLFAQQVTSNGGDPTALRRLEPTAEAPLEWGLLRGIDHRWQVLPFAKRYASPVLIAKPVSNKGADPGVIRVKGVSADQALVRYQEWDYLDGRHTREDLFYVISESGEHSLAGLTLEAGRLTTNKLARAGQWESLSFGAWFDEPPAVFAGVLTANGADAVTTRIRNLTATGLRLAMDEQESKADGHTQETLGWIAVQMGSGATAEGRRLQVFATGLTDLLTPVTYPAPTSHRSPSVVADVDSSFGLDPVFLRYADPTSTGIKLKLAEEKSADAETSHVLEDVGIFVGE